MNETLPAIYLARHDETAWSLSGWHTGLSKARRKNRSAEMLDPDGHDFATNHMIVIGHSMGGVLARTLITDSGDAVWNSVFAKPISGIRQYKNEAYQLRRWFYFQNAYSSFTSRNKGGAAEKHHNSLRGVL